MKIALVGRGRVATHLKESFLQAGHCVQMCGGRDGLEPMADDVQVVVISINDDALQDISDSIVLANPDTLVVHTAGSVPMDILPYSHRGVLYPMQTFSINRHPNMHDVPFFVETAMKEDMAVLQQLAHSISDQVMVMDSKRRKILHLAAVLCCNFTNHLFDLTAGLLERNGIQFSTMLPLIDETVAKVHQMHPRDAQTGPAVRGDDKVIAAHLAMIDDPYLRVVYETLSKSIVHYDKLRPEEDKTDNI